MYKILKPLRTIRESKDKEEPIISNRGESGGKIKESKQSNKVGGGENTNRGREIRVVVI